MADMILPSELGISQLTIADWAPGQENVVAPYDPTVLSAGPAATSWTGAVRLSARNPHGLPSVDRNMLAFRARLRGNRHRVRLPLTKAYRGETPPEDASATATAARIDGDVVKVSFSANNFGAWTPTAGSFINVGERLYLLHAFEPAFLDLIPAVVPLAIRRPRGIFPTPGGGAPAGFDGRGLGMFRGSTYEGGGVSGANTGIVYWVDLATGTRRQVLDVGNRPIRSLGSAFGYMLAGFGGGGSEGTIRLVDLDLADPSRNRLVDLYDFTDLGSGGSDRLRGLVEWQGRDDSGPKLYVSKNNELWKSNAPPTLTLTPGTFASLFTRVTGPTGFSRIGGLSVGPDGKLWVLDTGANKVYTWDGAVQEEVLSGTCGAEPGPNVIQLNNCWAIEWINGELYVLHRAVGTTGAGIARINIDTPATAVNIEFANPFVWALLSGNARTGPVGHQFPPTIFDWTEKVR